MSSLRVRRALEADAAQLRDYSCAMALETEGITLDPGVVLSGIRALLADDSRGFYLVAELDDDERGAEVVGQLMVTFEWSDWRDGVQYWIQSVYTRPDARRRGVYRQLYARLLALARADPMAVGVRLYVHHDNSAAQRVYATLGMEEAPYRIFEVDFVIER